jgi:hypothetical protein
MDEVRDLEAAGGMRAAALALIILVALQARGQPTIPENDSFATRIALFGANVTTAGANAGATKEIDEPDPNFSGGRSVWWTWTAPTDGHLTIDTAGSGFDTMLTVFTGDSVTNLTLVAFNDTELTTSIVTFNVVAGTAYQIAVDGTDGTNSTGNISLQLSLGPTVPPPANDNFANRTALTGTHLSNVPGSNVGAGAESGEPFHADTLGLKSVWWTWTAPASGGLTLTSSGSSTRGGPLDTALAVYTGNSIGGLTLVAGNDEDDFGYESTVTCNVISNVTYQIAVDGYEGDEGEIKLRLDLGTAFPVPAHDNFANRKALSGSNVSTNGSNVGASFEADEPMHMLTFGGKSVWYRWTAPSSGSVSLSVSNDLLDTVVCVYRGTSLGTLTFVAGNDEDFLTAIDGDSTAYFNATSGTTYQIAVDGFDGDTGNFRLRLSMDTTEPVPANNNFANRITVTGSNTTVTGSNLGANREPGEPLHRGYYGGSSVWWRWTSPGPGFVTLDTIGSLCDTILAVYTGSTLAELAEIAADDNSGGTDYYNSLITFPTKGNVTYQIAVDGYDGDAWDLRLRVRFTPASYGLTVTTNPPEAGSVDISPLPDQAGKYVPGAIVTLTATPGTFTGWSGSVSSTDNPLTLAMTSNKTLAANFSANSPPVLAPIGNKSVNEGVLLAFTASATDPEGHTLTFSLGPGAPAGASITPGGDFTWTPNESQGPGAYNVTIRVTDNGSPVMSDSETISITVNEVNAAPVLTAIGNKSVNEGSALSFTASATDSDLPAQALTFALIGAPAGASINQNNGNFNWTPSESQGGLEHVFTVRITDNGSPTQNDEETITVTVNKVNNAPVLAAIGNKSVNEGNALSFTATATDPDLPAQALTFTLFGAPAGASINSSSGAFAWTPTESQGGSNYIFTVRVTDNGSPSQNDEETITVTVNEVNSAPVLAAIGNKSVNEGSALSFTATATDPDSPAQALAFTLANAPIGASINQNNGNFNWTPSESQGGSNHVFTVRVTDNGSPAQNDEETITVTVNKVNNAPVLAAIGNKSVNEGGTLSFTATATDQDLPAQALTFALIGAPAGASINSSSGAFIWTPTQSQGGSNYILTVRVTDNGSPSQNDEETITVTVNQGNAPPVLAAIGNKSVNEGSALSFTATATDPDSPAQALTFALVGAPAGANINRNNGNFNWMPSESQGGSNHVFTVRVTDDGSPAQSDEETITVTVNKVNSAPVLAAIGNKSVSEGSTLSFMATATDSDLPAQALTFTLIGAPAGASINSSSGAFAWTPTQSQSGSNYIFTVRVTDNGSPSQNDEETITVTVNKVNSPPVLAAIGNKSVNEGSTLSFTATATDSDLPAQALTFTLIGAPAGASINSSSGAFAWTPTESQGGSNYILTVRVTDNGSPSQNDEETITVTVNEVNSPPVLAAIGNKSVNLGSTLSFTATATDPDLPAQALTFTLIGAPAGASINSSSGAFAWTPTESHSESNHTFTVRVTDNGSPTQNDEETISVTVNGAVNSPPVLGSIGDKMVNEGSSLAFIVTASDADLPAQRLTFSLTQGPAGASISTTGNFQWTPPNGSGTTTNQITIEVADNGTPSLTDAETFNVVVVGRPRIISISRAQSGHVTVQWQTFSGKTYRVQYTDNLGGNTWSDLQPDIAAAGGTASAIHNPSGPQLFYRVLLLE